MYPNKRQKKIDVYLLSKNEFQRKMKKNKLLEINSLFKSILNKLWSYCMQ
jgi:guanylate kinase